MSTCELCNEGIEGKHRWDVSEEWQICHQRENDCPEVDISIATSLGEYCSEKHAMETIESYLSERDAESTWADVSPFETCACCGVEFNTSTRHLTLTLMELSGPDENPNIHDAQYVARFCPSCASPENATSMLSDPVAPVTTVQPIWVGKD